MIFGSGMLATLPQLHFGSSEPTLQSGNEKTT
jgi:hypothetical protein